MRFFELFSVPLHAKACESAHARPSMQASWPSLNRRLAPEISLKYVFIMARPIKETPILYGEDARRFEARMKERRRISPEERAEMKATYEALKSVCDFM